MKNILLYWVAALAQNKHLRCRWSAKFFWLKFRSHLVSIRVYLSRTAKTTMNVCWQAELSIFVWTWLIPGLFNKTTYNLVVNGIEFWIFFAFQGFFSKSGYLCLDLLQENPFFLFYHHSICRSRLISFIYFKTKKKWIWFCESFYKKDFV